jgi:hypothetical protein
MYLRGTIRIEGMEPKRNNMHLGQYISQESFAAIVAADQAGDQEQLRAVLSRVLSGEYIPYATVEMLDVELLAYEQP